MAFLRASFGTEPAAIRGDGVWLRLPVMSDYPAWAELRARSRAHLTPWEPRWTADELSRSTFRLRVRLANREARDDTAMAFLIFRASDDVLVGGITLSNIRRGVAQSGTLGYWMGEPYKNCGFMKAAVGAVASHAFGRLRLHRVEAACLPENIASVRVLEACGFEREGLARQYLNINGAWRDHVLFARLRQDGHATAGGAA